MKAKTDTLLQRTAVLVAGLTLALAGIAMLWFGHVIGWSVVMQGILTIAYSQAPQLERPISLLYAAGVVVGAAVVLAGGAVLHHGGAFGWFVSSLGCFTQAFYLWDLPAFLRRQPTR